MRLISVFLLLIITLLAFSTPSAQAHYLDFLFLDHKLEKAVERGDIERIQRYIARGAKGNFALIIASLHGHVDIATLLIKNGAQVNTRDRNGTTPLHWAAACGHIKMAQVLLENGADINNKSKEGCTPLHYAAKYQQKGMAQFLLEQKANSTIKNNKGLTARREYQIRKQMGITRTLSGCDTTYGAFCA